MSQFELFELILLLKFNKQFPVEQFEPTVSQSTVPSSPLTLRRWGMPAAETNRPIACERAATSRRPHAAERVPAAIHGDQFASRATYQRKRKCS